MLVVSAIVAGVLLFVEYVYEPAHSASTPTYTTTTVKSNKATTTKHKKSNKKSKKNKRGNQMIVCPLCHGSGMNNSEDIFKSQMPCPGCGGKGQVTKAQYDQIVDYYTSQKNNQRSSDLCVACKGTGTCPVCKGYRGHNYGGVQYCETCGNTGRCKWCYGSGRQQYR